MIKISKSHLKYLYLKRHFSTIAIAKIYKCDDFVIYLRLKKYGIKIRNKSEAMKVLFKNPQNHPNYIDGRSFKKQYCKCGKQIGWKGKLRLCRNCAGIRNWKNKTYKKRRLEALHNHHIDGNHLNHNNNEIKLTSKEHRNAHNSLLQISYNLVKNGDIIFNRKKKAYEYNG